MNRRHFLAATAAATAATGLAPILRAAAAKRPPRILLRSSWQSVNIGDIGHTPGALSLLWKHFPECEITLWPGELGYGSRDLLTKGYPRLKIAEGSLGADGKPNKPALAQAWAEADLYLSGSGSGFPAANHAVAFQKATGKPVGVFGVSNDPISGMGKTRDPEGGTLNSLRERALKLPPTHLSEELRFIMDRAAFFFCRDTITRDYLKAQGVKSPIVEFGPDAQLGMHLRDDAKGLAYLKSAGLEEGKFISVIPRLRYTPYYRIRANAKRVPDDDIKDAINDRTTKQDHDKLRDMIVRYVRGTGNKVMACAEMTYQVELGRTHLYEKLPAAVRRSVVWRENYWMPDEAASIYAQALCVVGVEPHSLIMSLAAGTPIIHVRQPTDTFKGHMFRDVGLGDWLFEIEQATGGQLAAALGQITADPAASRARVREAMTGVRQLQQKMIATARAAIRH